MGALALRDHPPDLRPGERRRLVALPGGAPVRTLDHVISLAFTAVSAGAPAECPVCSGRLEACHTAGAESVGGRCRDCGSMLE
jgi:hypothetical protein